VNVDAYIAYWQWVMVFFLLLQKPQVDLLQKYVESNLWLATLFWTVLQAINTVILMRQTAKHIHLKNIYLYILTPKLQMIFSF
jgi:hypothetical protein